MATLESQGSSWMFRFCVWSLLVIGGMIIFLPTIVLPSVVSRGGLLVYRAGTTLMFFVIGNILLRFSRRYRKFWMLPYSLFVASASVLVSWIIIDWPLNWLSIQLRSPIGITAIKLTEAVIVILCVIVLTLYPGSAIGSVFLKRGKLRLGITIGLTSFILLFGFAVLQSAWQGITFGQIAKVAPLILVFTIANGVMDELLFRGLFLNRYEAVIGPYPAILATSLVFALAHIEFTYTQELPLFLALMFMFGIAWAAIMRMTDSIIASSLFHAGVDAILMTAIFTGTAIF